MLSTRYLCFQLGQGGEIYFHVCLQGTLEGPVRNKTLPAEGRRPWAHRLNDRRHKLRQVYNIYHNLFGIFSKLNFLNLQRIMYFTVFMLRYYFPVFTNWMNFSFVLPRLLLGFSKCLFMSLFWWFWCFYFNFDKEKDFSQHPRWFILFPFSSFRILCVLCGFGHYFHNFVCKKEDKASLVC